MKNKQRVLKRLNVVKTISREEAWFKGYDTGYKEALNWVLTND